MIEIQDFWDESKTVFGPKYNYSICNAKIEGDMKPLIEEITSRDESGVNLMEFNDTELIVDAIKDMHRCYLIMKEEEELDEIYIQSRVFIQKKGEKYEATPDVNENTSYLSGQIILQQDNTNTYYVRPFALDVKNSHKIPDNEKSISIFPSWLKHYSDTVFGDTQRITINFAIITRESFSLHIPPARKQRWNKV